MIVYIGQKVHAISGTNQKKCGRYFEKTLSIYCKRCNIILFNSVTFLITTYYDVRKEGEQVWLFVQNVAVN